MTGISWYEAAGYSAFAGKQLPTLYQWNHVAGLEEVTAEVFPWQISRAAGYGRSPNPRRFIDSAPTILPAT